MSGQMYATPTRSFASTAALNKYRRVTVTSDVLAYAGADDRGLGTLEVPTTTDDEVGSVRLWTAEGTRMMVASAAISAMAYCYATANGKVGPSGSVRIGRALQAAGADGDVIEVLPLNQDEAASSIDGGITFDEDFVGDYPAAGSAMAAPWTKVETNGLGVVGTAASNGVLTFAFDAVAEAATAALYIANLPFDVDDDPIVEFRLAVFDIGDDAALDINFGLASGTHATDFDSVSQYAAFHLDGTDLSVKCRSKDGTTTVADTDTTVDLVDDTYATFKIDATDKADVKFYINGTRVLSSTTFTLAAYSSRLTPIVHVEKTSNDTTADVRVDRIRVTCNRAA